MRREDSCTPTRVSDPLLQGEVNHGTERQSRGSVPMNTGTGGSHGRSEKVGE